MKLEKAKELLGYLDTDPGLMKYQDYKDAVKLGIEALKFRQMCKKRKIRFSTFPLPGETED